MFADLYRNWQRRAKSHRVSNLFFVGVLGFLLSGLAYGQGGGGVDMTGTGGSSSINGRIYFPSGRRTDESLKVKLESVNSSGRTVFSDSNGSFSFRNLEPGSYRITIDGGEHYESVQETVLIDDTRSKIFGSSQVPRNYTLPIYLQPKRTVSGDSKPNVINAALAGVPKVAANLYSEGVKLAQQGETEKAAAKFREALVSYPQFGLAMNELGVQYLKLGQPERAVDVLKNAAALSPEAVTPRLNYGAALLSLRRYDDAEAEFREVLKKDDSSAAAHFYLGLTLVGTSRGGKPRRYDEAQRELNRVVELGGVHVGRAYYSLAGIYWDERKFDKAADSLERFLKISSNVSKEERDRTTKTIADLRKKQ